MGSRVVEWLTVRSEAKSYDPSTLSGLGLGGKCECAGRQVSFYNRFLVPITLILLSASTALIAGLYAMTHQQDARERHREEQVVALALAGQIDGLQKVLRGYARWDDAAANAVTGFDTGWLDDQFGIYLHESNGYEANFIVDERGRTLYAAIHGKRTIDAADRHLGRDYRQALTTTAAQRANKETAVGGLSVGAHGPLLFAVHRILPSPGSALPPGAPRRYMVVAKEVDELLALDNGQAAQIAAPRLVRQPNPIRAAVPVRTYAGSTIGCYAWAPTTPWYRTATRQHADPRWVRAGAAWAGWDRAAQRLDRPARAPGERGQGAAPGPARCADRPAQSASLNERLVKVGMRYTACW